MLFALIMKEITEMRDEDIMEMVAAGTMVATSNQSKNSKQKSMKHLASRSGAHFISRRWCLCAR